MLEFRLTAPGINNLALRLTTPIRDFYPIWPKVRAWFQRMETRQFESQGARGAHGEWRANASSTAKRKLSKYGFEHTLVATGALYDSLTGDSGESIDERWPDRIRLGSQLRYAAVHQTGTDRAGRYHNVAIPQRRMIDPTDRDRRDLERVILAGIATMYRKAGFKVLGKGAGPAEARTAGRAFYQGLANAGAPISIMGGDQFPLNLGM